MLGSSKGTGDTTDVQATRSNPRNVAIFSRILLILARQATIHDYQVQVPDRPAGILAKLIDFQTQEIYWVYAA